MYVLPNNKPIDMKALEKAFLDLNVKRRYYLDSETGRVILLAKENTPKIKPDNGSRYFLAPKLPERLMIIWMKEFAREMVPYDNPQLSQKLLKALNKDRPVKKFMEILEPDISGWIHGWAQWEADHIYEEIEEWFCGLSIKIEDDMSELDDDCPLCRMMKEGVDDYETIKHGFREANAKQMVDSIFSDKEKKKKNN